MAMPRHWIVSRAEVESRVLGVLAKNGGGSRHFIVNTIARAPGSTVNYDALDAAVGNALQRLRRRGVISARANGTLWRLAKAGTDGGNAAP